MPIGQPDWKRYAAVDVFEQTIGMYLIRDWSAKLGFYKTWIIKRTLAPGETVIEAIYTVPADKTLFVNDFAASVYYAGAFGETSIWISIIMDVIELVANLTGTTRNMHFPLSRSQPIVAGGDLAIACRNTSAVELVCIFSILAYEASSPRKKRLYRVNERQMYERGMFNDCDMEIGRDRKVKLRLYNALADLTVEARGELDERGRLNVKPGKTRDVKWWE